MKETDSETIHRAGIRELNNQFRVYSVGNGQLLITAGVQARGGEFVAAVLQAMREYDKFNPHDDPWNEHDFAAIAIGDEKALWKIDYYNIDCTKASPNAADETVTCRVLNIMLAEEY